MRSEKARTSNISSLANDPTSQEEDIKQRTGWPALLTFTEKKQFPHLAGAILVTIGAGAVLPIYNVFFGKVLDTFTDYAAGRLDESSFLHKLSLDCGIIACIGLASWVLDGAYLMLWILVGEMQARACREMLFEELLGKPVAWYDTRKSGIAALMPRLQT